MNYAAMYCNVVQCIAMWQLKYVEIEVVDAVPWHGGVLLGHPAAVSVLLLSDQLLGWNWLGQGWRAIAACINFKYKHDRKAARVGANLTHPRLSKATCDVQLGCRRAHVMSEPILSADATTWKKLSSDGGARDFSHTSLRLTHVATHSCRKLFGSLAISPVHSISSKLVSTGWLFRFGRGKALIAMHLTDQADPVCLADCLKELQRVQCQGSSVVGATVHHGQR
jgi:hypothetical protein